MANGRLDEINQRFDKLLATLNEGLAESDRLKERTDQSLDALHEAVLELGEPEAPEGESAVSGRHRRVRV